MKRIVADPRQNWQKTVESQGFHSIRLKVNRIGMNQRITASHLRRSTNSKQPPTSWTSSV